MTSVLDMPTGILCGAIIGMTFASHFTVVLLTSNPQQETFAKVSIKGEGILSVGWIGLLCALPCGYCLEASMTATTHPPCGFPPARE